MSSMIIGVGIGILIGLVPFAILLWVMSHPEFWWPRR